MAPRIACGLAIVLLAFGAAPTVHAQPADLPIAPADGTPLPKGVRVKKSADGSVYADARGHTLYGMDMRTVLRWAPDPARFCAQDCTREWAPLLAPPGTKPNIRYPIGFEKAAEMPPAEDQITDPRKAPDWTVIEGAAGPQWVYKGWHLVFTRRAAGGNAPPPNDMTWNTLKFVPAPPRIAAPGLVATAYFGGAYALTDRDGRVLFTGHCAAPCAWRPLPAPMASGGLGDWKVSLSGDRAEWTFKGQQVFVSEESDPHAIPRGGRILRPQTSSGENR